MDRQQFTIVYHSPSITSSMFRNDLKLVRYTRDVSQNVTSSINQISNDAERKLVFLEEEEQ